MELNSIGYIYPRVVEATDWLELEKYKELEGGFGVFIFSDFFSSEICWKSWNRKNSISNL